MKQKRLFQISLILAFLFFFQQNIHAQDFWELLPFPDSLDITCLAVNQQGDIFVGTASGNQDNGLFRSTDSGQTWEKILTTENFQIYTFSINEMGHIFVSTGGFYPLRASFNNGITWDTIPMPFNAGIAKIEFLGQDTILMGTSLSNGAILLSTSDLGVNWDTLFLTENHTSEYVADIAIAPNGDIYISLSCFFQDMGGVYKSTDGGAIWEFLGLLNHQVIAVEVNYQGDLFIGNFSGDCCGIGALYHDNPYNIENIFSPHVNDLVLNSAGDIYASVSFYGGVVVSKDNGITFDFENSGLPYFPMGRIEKDSDDFIYALLDMPSNRIYRTASPTVGLQKIRNIGNSNQILVAPNPVNNILKGTFYEDNTDGIYSYTISDINNRMILKDWLNLFQNSFFIDISFLPPGFYLLEVNYNGFNYSAKIIKI